MVHWLHKEMTSLVRRFMGRFFPASLIADVPLKDMKFMDASLQLPDKELFLGVAAQSLWGDNMDELSSSVPMMIQAVRDFFVAVTAKMMTAFPLDNIILQSLTVLDPESRHQFSPNSERVPQ
ncbi:Bax inhibitor 1 [Sarotherodon galilaeus]